MLDDEALRSEDQAQLHQEREDYELMHEGDE